MDIKRDFKKRGNKYPDYLKSWCGYICSFSSFLFHGYNTDKDQKRDYQKLSRYRCLYNESYSSDNEKQGKATNLENIKFVSKDYSEINVPENSVIFSDAPYLGACKDGYLSQFFDFDKYYRWLIETATIKGVEIYVAELYMPPEYFEVIWEKKHIYQLKKGIVSERLYRVKRSVIQR